MVGVIVHAMVSKWCRLLWVTTIQVHVHFDSEMNHEERLQCRRQQRSGREMEEEREERLHPVSLCGVPIIS